VRLEAGFTRGSALVAYSTLTELLAGIGTLEFAEADTGKQPEGHSRPAGSIGVVGKGFEAFVFIREAVDAAQLAAKFAKDLEKDGKFLLALEAKLANENFAKNAPSDLVAAEREKLEDVKRRSDKLRAYVRDLS